MISQSQAEAIVATLQDGWNAGDGNKYASPFADDADFVTVAGLHAQGKQAIANNHERIFATVYKGSEVSMRVHQFRPISDGLSLLHIGATLKVPGGPFAGTHEALMTTIVDGNGEQPRIVALQNTIVRDLSQAIAN